MTSQRAIQDQSQIGFLPVDAAEPSENPRDGSAPRMVPRQAASVGPGSRGALPTLSTLGVAGSALLTGCGGGGGSAAPTVTSNAAEASRFLAQASMGATKELIASVQSLGYESWLEEQFAMPQTTSRWDWLVAKGYSAITYRSSEAGFDASTWRKLLKAPDTLRQRVTLALSEILVVGLSGLAGWWRNFTGAAYLDLLEEHAFGNYRALLQAISTSPAMGEYLTFRGNAKYNVAKGSMPDENYARELMQLFTIGLVELQPDGTPRLLNGQARETYSLDDITGLARVFTGWDYDLTSSDNSTPDYKRRPMIQVPSRHETGEKTFLGTTIPAGTGGEQSLNLALDALFAHPNVAPFVSRQLIQRLVCSNPSPAYVGRVAATFSNDGAGIKGNLKAVIKAILLDDEARNPAHVSDSHFGKVREPLLRFTAWARAFEAASPGDLWAIGNTSDPATKLGQSPLRAPSVFNFFRPGYVPPNSAIARQGLVAPEFQITGETSVVGYINFMQRVISTGMGDVKADYRLLLPLAANAQGLVEELNMVLVAGQLTPGTKAMMVNALESLPADSDEARTRRVLAALTLVFSTPEFIVQK